MTVKEFDKIRLDIQKERYTGPFSDPIAFGILRAKFDQVRFKRLVTEAGKVTNPTKSLLLRVAQWKRQQTRAISTQRRLEQTREIAARQLGLPAGGASVMAAA